MSTVQRTAQHRAILIILDRLLNHEGCYIYSATLYMVFRINQKWLIPVETVNILVTNYGVVTMMIDNDNDAGRAERLKASRQARLNRTHFTNGNIVRLYRA